MSHRESARRREVGPARYVQEYKITFQQLNVIAALLDE
jgi:hypothetical protein